MWQSMGHGVVLHDRVSALCGQATPPKFAPTFMRTRDCELGPLAPAHVLPQTVHALHEPTLQSVGHDMSLHGRVSSLCGQALPP